MNDQINYKNNPLHGVSLKKLLTELEAHYGFEILFAYLNINCFKTNPSIESSVKFLKKTDWAREKVESFYLYQFKNLPRASASQFQLSPRDRIIPEDQIPGEPATLSLEDAERLREKRAKQAADKGFKTGHRSKTDKKEPKKNDKNIWRAPESSTPSPTGEKLDPWANWKKR
jgi:uncharacterized protein (DUF2132 family)